MIVMTFATKSFSTLPGRVTRAAIRTADGVKFIIRAVLHRRDVMRLSELDERGLKDIGLVRGDIDGALSVSWLRDPSVILATRSAQQNAVAAQRRDIASRRSAGEATRRVVKPADTVELACNA